MIAKEVPKGTVNRAVAFEILQRAKLAVRGKI
jgi:hypothetical protein